MYYWWDDNYSHNDERCVDYWLEFNLGKEDEFDEIKRNIKEKRYNKFKDEQYCKFSFDQNINCVEFGYQVKTIHGVYTFRNYTIEGDSPILGCFNFYINLFGVNN